MSRPPLDWTPAGTNTSNAKIFHLGSTPFGVKTPDPKPLTLPTYSSKYKENSKIVRTKGFVVRLIIVRLIIERI